MSPSLKASMPPCASARRSSLFATAVHLEHGQERLLRDLDRAHLLHPLLALLLLLEQLALTGDVAAVELGGDVLAERFDGLARDHVRADRCLYRHVEELSRDRLPQPLDQSTAPLVGRIAMDDQ